MSEISASSTPVNQNFSGSNDVSKGIVEIDAPDSDPKLEEDRCKGPSKGHASSAESTDTLPIFKYGEDQLANYILRQLGQPVWHVEITKQHILDNIQDSMALHNVWRPQMRFMSLQLERSRFEYLENIDVGMGIIDVTFVEPNPVPTELFYGNLIDPAPLFRTGLDEYDIFLRWRKIWERVTSIKPDWRYDEYRKTLLIHNPIARFHCGVICHFPYCRTKHLDYWGADWVKRYALESARFLYGDILQKFSGNIPTPGGGNIQLDQGKRDKAEAKLEKLQEELKKAQRFVELDID